MNPTTNNTPMHAARLSGDVNNEQRSDISLRPPESRDRRSKRVSHFNLALFDPWYGLRLDDWLILNDAFVPRRYRVGFVILLDVSPIGADKIAVPSVEVMHTDLAHELHAESCRLIFVRVKRSHKLGFVGRVFECCKLVGKRWGGPLDAVTK